MIAVIVAMILVLTENAQGTDASVFASTLMRATDYDIPRMERPAT